jgi:hypothetical protein
MDVRWLPIDGYDGAYEVSDDGRVRSVDRIIIPAGGGPEYKLRGTELVQKPHRKGYLQVALSKNSVVKYPLVHRLVAAAFVIPVTGPQVNHMDFNKKNNRYKNLEWTSDDGNRQHAIIGGRFRKAARKGWT